MKLKEFYEKIMLQYRCSQCNKLLFKGKIRGDYHIECLCSRCKKINVIERKVIEKEVNLTNKSN